MHEHQSDRESRSLWFAVMLLAGCLVAAAAGLLTVAGGASAPAAVLFGAGAFAGSITLMLLISSYFGGKQ